MNSPAARTARQRASRPPVGPDAAATRSSGSAARAPVAVLYLVFTLSGLTGLVYEATWTRYLQLFLGHAAYAQVLVLALFMGGMGAGALLAGRVGSARMRPLVAYALIEAVLGVAALGFHLVYDAATTYAYAAILTRGEGPGASLAQWLLAGALIVPQSVLLGMTFPLMSAAVLRLRAGGGGRVFATLYFTNSAGAVVGVLLAGFWLFERYGLQATMMAAGAGNLIVSATAFWIARRSGDEAPAVVRRAEGATVGHWLLGLAFLTGAASFLYEIAWLRMLALVQGASTHAFETMLSAFILGIALGGLWIRGRIERVASPLLTLARVQILMGLAAVATLPAYHYAFDAMQQVVRSLPRTDLGYAGYSIAGYLISAVIMVPAAFFAGMTLPLLTSALYARGRGESEIGAVYGWNTLGSIAGIALASLVLMPQLGVKNVLAIGAGIDVALGVALALVLFRRGEMRAPRREATLAGAAIAAVLAAAIGFHLDLARTASSVFRHGNARIAEGAQVVFHADGRTATVDLVRFRDGTLSILTNGKTDAAINMARARGNLNAAAGSDEITMTLLGALPLAHVPDARRAAVIGHGSGLSTHVLLGSPTIERVDVIEIEPEMIRAARAFRPRVARAYDDPRAHFIVDDARAIFARARERYDIVVSEPSNPWVSGVASLFTPEFYRFARRSLADGGVFVQWFQIYEFDRNLVRSIITGVGSVFADYVLYAANDTDVVLVASAGRMPALSDTLFSWPAMRADLGYLGIRTPTQLRMFRVASRRAYAPLLEGGPRNSDYFPFLEFGAARARFLGGDDRSLVELARDPVPVLELLSGFEPPALADPSGEGAVRPKRFLEVQRAAFIAAAISSVTGDVPAASSYESDARNLRRVREARPAMSLEAWGEWYSALFDLSKPLIPNGGAASFERLLREGDVARALAAAPPEILEKVEFLRLVARRDVAGIRAEGKRFLASHLPSIDPSFYAYALVATATACLVPPMDSSCDPVWSALDHVQRESPVIDLLRAHRAALTTSSAAPRQ